MCPPSDSKSFFITVQADNLIRAWLAQQKAQGEFFGETVETLTWKISRLEKINMILRTMEKVYILTISHHKAHLIELFCSQDPKQFIPLLDDPADPDLPTPNPEPVKDFLEKNIKLKEATVEL
jgi:hypothetical protein